MLNGLSSGVHGWIDLCRLWKKQRFSCDRGWAVWEGLSQHQLPLGMRKRGYFSISICLLFPLFFLFISFHSFLPFFLLPSNVSCPCNICLFQRKKQSFLFNHKGSAGSRYFEENMKGWSGHSMLILDWTVAMAALYSLSAFVIVHGHACMSCMCWVALFFIHAALIEGYWMACYSSY